MMEGSIVQLGGAVRHQPLPSLVALAPSPSDPSDTHEKSAPLKNGGQGGTLGGFIGEGQLAWRSLGPTIEVIDPLTSGRQAAWTFGALLHNTSPRVLCVCGIGVGAATHLAVGVDLGREHKPRGMVAVLSLRRSRIIRAFHFPHQVTSVCMVTGGEKVVDPCTLTSELRVCQGLLAVGTAHAQLFLVDLALDLGDEITSDEISPASFLELSIPDPHVALKRDSAISNHRHPVFCLSDPHPSSGVFRLLGPDDSVLHEAPSHGVFVSCLAFFPSLASLGVGLSFGAFQIINLRLLTIDCASPFEDHLPPVLSFAYQEPEDDPRSFVYLWVARSPQPDSSPGLKWTCSLYAMNYERKEWIEGHGLWYQGLASMAPRLDIDSSSAALGKECPLSSRLTSALTVTGTAVTSPGRALVEDALPSEDEGSEPVPELSLALFAWEGQVLREGGVVSKHYVAVFDINQWYQSQMPSRLRLESGALCPFLSFHTLDKVPLGPDETPLGGAPTRGAWARHGPRGPCERTWFPSSLSFEYTLLTAEGLAAYRCPSVQQCALLALLSRGPGAIVNPRAAYGQCVFAGIASGDGTAVASGSATVNERECLLDVSLEYHLLPLLLACVAEFGEGRFRHLGCSPEVLLEWAWGRLRRIKARVDALCAPLLSPPGGGGDPLSADALSHLHRSLTFLSHLGTVITAIRDHAGPVTKLSAGELEGRVQVIQLVQLHLQVTLWFYHCGLLPQTLPSDPSDEGVVPFPGDTLRALYQQRRREISALSPHLGETGLLLIDSLTEDCGALLGEVWGAAGGPGGGLYPPPSLEALLGTYLIPDMAPRDKHRLVQYLFLDLASLLSQNHSSLVEELVKFPSSFSLSPSLIKLTQAFWLIDNKDFQAGLSVLLDPLVNPADISPQQHRRIIKAFMYQGEESPALAYAHLRRPPQQEPEDVRLLLSLLLANGRIPEAFHFQRQHRVADNARDLLTHLFRGCEELGRLESVVHLPLSALEEDAFVAHLKHSDYPSAPDILLVYYLQQSRYGEICSLDDPSPAAARRQSTRSAIVQGYISHLPDVRARMAGSVPSKARPPRTLCSKPVPLSARIRQSSGATHTPRTRATSFRALQSGGALGGKGALTPHTPFRSKAQRRTAIMAWHKAEAATSAKEERRAPRVVFPTHLVEEFPSRSATPSLASPLGMSHRADVTELQKDITRVMAEVLSGSYKFTSSNNSAKETGLNVMGDVVSLLKTPPVGRRSSGIAVSRPETPQSILKVRKMLHLSQSSTDGQEDSPNEVTFPKLRNSFRADTSLDSSSLPGSALTPKHLRFDLPSNLKRVSTHEEEEGKEEEEEEEEGRGILRKRKRSPSPPPSIERDASPARPMPRKPMPGFVKGASDLILSFGLEEEEPVSSPACNRAPLRRGALPSPVTPSYKCPPVPGLPSPFREPPSPPESDEGNRGEEEEEESFHSVEGGSSSWAPPQEEEGPPDSEALLSMAREYDVSVPSECHLEEREEQVEVEEEDLFGMVVVALPGPHDHLPGARADFQQTVTESEPVHIQPESVAVPSKPVAVQHEPVSLQSEPVTVQQPEPVTVQQAAPVTVQQAEPVTVQQAEPVTVQPEPDHKQPLPVVVPSEAETKQAELVLSPPEPFFEGLEPHENQSEPGLLKPFPQNGDQNMSFDSADKQVEMASEVPTNYLPSEYATEEVSHDSTSEVAKGATDEGETLSANDVVDASVEEGTEGPHRATEEKGVPPSANLDSSYVLRFSDSEEDEPERGPEKPSEEGQDHHSSHSNESGPPSSPAKSSGPLSSSPVKEAVPLPSPVKCPGPLLDSGALSSPSKDSANLSSPVRVSGPLSSSPAKDTDPLSSPTKGPLSRTPRRGRETPSKGATPATPLRRSRRLSSSNTPQKTPIVRRRRESGGPKGTPAKVGPSMDKAPLIEATLLEAPSEYEEEKLMDNTSAEAPQKEAPSQATLMKEALKKENLPEVTPMEAPAKATPMKEAPTKATPLKEAPAKATPIKEAPTKATPMKEAPAKATPMKEAPLKEPRTPGRPRRRTSLGAQTPPVTPQRRSARLSGAAKGPEEGPLETITEDAPLQADLLQKRTRRRRTSAASSIAEEQEDAPLTPSRLSGKGGDDAPLKTIAEDTPQRRSRRRRDSAASSIAEEEEAPADQSLSAPSLLAENGCGPDDYALIPDEEGEEDSPGTVPEGKKGKRKSRYLSSKSIVLANAQQASKPQLRKSLHSLSVPLGFEFPSGEDSPASVTPQDASLAGADDSVFAAPEEEESADPSPQPVYHLLEGVEGIAPGVPLVSRKRQKSRTLTYRRGIRSMTGPNALLSGAEEEEGKEEEDEREGKEEDSPLPSRKKAKRGGRTSSQKGFVFKDPEELVATPEGVSSVFAELTRETERFVADSFVFSPPFSLAKTAPRKKRGRKPRKL